MPGVEASEAAACHSAASESRWTSRRRLRFLCDDARSAWITGQSLVVDGGYSTHGQGADFGFLRSTLLSKRQGGDPWMRRRPVSPELTVLRS